MTDLPGHWRNRLKDVASRLDQVVVSLDRIGSLEPDPRARADAIQQFVEGWGIAGSLGEARRQVYALLEETVDKQTLGDDEDFVDKLGVVELPIWPGATR